jgi:hypothetical protein
MFSRTCRPVLEQLEERDTPSVATFPSPIPMPSEHATSYDASAAFFAQAQLAISQVHQFFLAEQRAIADSLNVKNLAVPANKPSTDLTVPPITTPLTPASTADLLVFEFATLLKQQQKLT